MGAQHPRPSSHGHRDLAPVYREGAHHKERNKTVNDGSARPHKGWKLATMASCTGPRRPARNCSDVAWHRPRVTPRGRTRT